MKKFFGLITAVLFSLFLATGCQAMYFPEAMTGAVPDLSQYANFRMLLSDEPNAIGDFATVEVTITGFGLLPAGEDKSWIEKELDPPWVGDLKELLGANASQVWAGIIEPGDYLKAFIYVKEIKATLTGDTPVTIKIPSGKLQISKPFSVTADGKVDFVFDITIVKAGNSGNYIVKPQIGESGPDKEFKEVKKEHKENNGNGPKDKNGNGPKEKEDSFKGTIVSFTETSLEVEIGEESHTVDITDADVKGTPDEGLMVKIEGEMNEDGSITATSIHVLDDDDDEEDDEDEDEIEFCGPVSSLTPLVIAGYTVVTDADTKQDGVLVVGVNAEVEGILQDDGTVLAKHISVEDDDDDDDDDGDGKGKGNNGNGNGNKKK